MSIYTLANTKVMFRGLRKSEAYKVSNLHLPLTSLSSYYISTHKQLLDIYGNPSNAIFAVFDIKDGTDLSDVKDYMIPIDLFDFKYDVTYKITNGIYLIDDKFECYARVLLREPYNNILNYFSILLCYKNKINYTTLKTKYRSLPQYYNGSLLGIFHTPIKTENITFIGGLIDFNHV